MSEDSTWKNDSEDLNRLLSSYEDYTDDMSIGSGSGLLDGSYVDVNQRRGYGVDVEDKSSSSSSILKIFVLFVTIGTALNFYAKTLPVDGSFPMEGQKEDGMDVTTILGLSSIEEKDEDDYFERNGVSDEESGDDIYELVRPEADDLAQPEHYFSMDDGLVKQVEIDDTVQNHLTDDLYNQQSSVETNDINELIDDDDVTFTATEKSTQQKQIESTTITNSTKTNLRKSSSNEVAQNENEAPTTILENADSESTSKPIKIEENRPKINRVALLAERNSGLSWFASEIHSCFPDLEITMGLARASHWFQSNETAIPEPTIVMPLFLNTYHWVDNMRKHPHHAPNHKNKEWVQFVSNPWSVHRPKEDFELLESVKDSDKLNCQLGFKYNEVISCSDMTVGLGKDGPIYELKNNGSGEPYLTVLELRRDKILNWLSTSEWENVEFVHPVHYEDLAEKGGLLSAIKVIEIKTKTKSSCSYDKARNNVAPIFWDDLHPDYVDWMKNNANWDVEKKIGYNQIVPKILAKPSPVVFIEKP